jgi:hypothetical protein
LPVFLFNSDAGPGDVRATIYPLTRANEFPGTVGLFLLAPGSTGHRGERILLVVLKRCRLRTTGPDPDHFQRVASARKAENTVFLNSFESNARRTPPPEVARAVLKML